MEQQQAGTYWGRLKSSELKFTNDGKPHFDLVFSVDFIDRNGNWVPLDAPLERTMAVYLTDAAKPTSRQKLVAVGFNGNFKSPGYNAIGKNDKGEDLTVITGGAALRCEIETYKDKPHEKWELADWGGRDFCC